MDVELLVQYLVLCHAHEQPDLICTATAQALRRLDAAGVLGSRDFEVLSGAHSFYRDVMQATRGACLSGALPESMSHAFAAHLPAMVGESCLSGVEAKLYGLQGSVQDVFERLTSI